MDAFYAKSLTKTYGSRKVVDEVTLQLPRGSVLGLLGRNGAGKTTLLRLAMGLLRPDSGKVELLGAEYISASAAHRERVAYVSQQQRLPEEMTPLELLDYMSGFYARWDADLARRGLERFGLDPKRPIGRFSGGEQRKLAVAAALAARPDLLLLDEPAAGLDPISRRDLLDALIELLGAVEGCTLILSTHLLADLERLADRIAVMKEGRLTLNDSLEEIQRRFRSVQLLFDREPGPDFVVPGLIQSQKNGLVWNCLLECPDERLLDQLRSLSGLQVIPNELSLEELFVRHLGKEM